MLLRQWVNTAKAQLGSELTASPGFSREIKEEKKKKGRNVLQLHCYDFRSEIRWNRRLFSEDIVRTDSQLVLAVGSCGKARRTATRLWLIVKL